ncbi:MAG: hypothetical protein IT381_18735 [Deltaproteobacteria bacterium]|nr:hypothetical protein [Deltaproteobacteria bacterium]
MADPVGKKKQTPAFAPETNAFSNALRGWLEQTAKGNGPPMTSDLAAQIATQLAPADARALIDALRKLEANANDADAQKVVEIFLKLLLKLSGIDPKTEIVGYWKKQSLAVKIVTAIVAAGGLAGLAYSEGTDAVKKATGIDTVQSFEVVPKRLSLTGGLVAAPELAEPTIKAGVVVNGDLGKVNLEQGALAWLHGQDFENLFLQGLRLSTMLKVGDVSYAYLGELTWSSSDVLRATTHAITVDEKDGTKLAYRVAIDFDPSGDGVLLVTPQVDLGYGPFSLATGLSLAPNESDSLTGARVSLGLRTPVGSMAGGVDVQPQAGVPVRASATFSGSRNGITYSVTGVAGSGKEEKAVRATVSGVF